MACSCSGLCSCRLLPTRRTGSTRRQGRLAGLPEKMTMDGISRPWWQVAGRMPVSGRNSSGTTHSGGLRSATVSSWAVVTASGGASICADLDSSHGLFRQQASYHHFVLITAPCCAQGWIGLYFLVGSPHLPSSNGTAPADVFCIPCCIHHHADAESTLALAGIGLELGASTGAAAAGRVGTASTGLAPVPRAPRSIGSSKRASKSDERLGKVIEMLSDSEGEEEGSDEEDTAASPATKNKGKSEGKSEVKLPQSYSGTKSNYKV